MDAEISTNRNIIEQSAGKMEELNPLTGFPYTRRYYEMLEKRKQLPAWQHKQAFLHLLSANQTIIVVGGSGTGKTTQIPQFAVEALNNFSSSSRMIACTQPHWLAAMSVCSHVAKEMDVAVGEEVAYAERYDDCSGPNTVLKYITEAALLREAMADRLLQSYSIVIVDDTYERTEPTEILLGHLKKVQCERSNLRPAGMDGGSELVVTPLKVVVISATMKEAEIFQSFFSGAQLLALTSPGRGFSLHSVEIVHADYGTYFKYTDESVDRALHIHACEPPGDVLIFLPDEGDAKYVWWRIRRAIGKMDGTTTGPAEVLLLHDRLPREMQQRVFEPPNQCNNNSRNTAAGETSASPPVRKIVVSTNTAASLTIEGIMYVIDSGKRIEILYNSPFYPYPGVNPLVREFSEVSSITKAMADQRAARAGRTQAIYSYPTGSCKCFRLYTKTEMRELPRPQVVRSNLYATLITLYKLGTRLGFRMDELADVVNHFIDPPISICIQLAVCDLQTLGVVAPCGSTLTPLGELISELHLDRKTATKLRATINPHLESSKKQLELLQIAEKLNYWLINHTTVQY